MTSPCASPNVGARLACGQSHKTASIDGITTSSEREPMSTPNATVPTNGNALLAIAIIAAVVLLVVATRKAINTLALLVHRRRPHSRRDAQRQFSSGQRARAQQLCNNRCEGGLLFRCKNTGALQGDHWFPHARGGATSWQNLVMLCQQCNNKKSDHLPTLAQTRAIQRRRRKGRGYTALGMSTTVGQWLPKASLFSRRHRG